VTPEERLERAYRRLLHAYPAAYRQKYEDEIVETLVTAAGPGRRRPTVPEAVDLVGGGLRSRLGLRRVEVPASLIAAAPVALALAAGLSAFWLTGAELSDEPMWPTGGWGPFMTGAPMMYIGWLVTIAVYCGFGRFGRGLALLCTVIAFSAHYVADPIGAPTHFGEFQQVLSLLGLAALALPRWPTRAQRAAIAAGTLGVAGIAWFGAWWASHIPGVNEHVLNEAFAGAGLACAATALTGLALLSDRDWVPTLRARAASVAVLAVPVGMPIHWLTLLIV
jgi:hypothetical protein